MDYAPHDYPPSRHYYDSSDYQHPYSRDHGRRPHYSREEPDSRISGAEPEQEEYVGNEFGGEEAEITANGPLEDTGFYDQDSDGAMRHHSYVKR